MVLSYLCLGVESRALVLYRQMNHPIFVLNSYDNFALSGVFHRVDQAFLEYLDRRQGDRNRWFEVNVSLDSHHSAPNSGDLIRELLDCLDQPSLLDRRFAQIDERVA